MMSLQQTCQLLKKQQVPHPLVESLAILSDFTRLPTAQILAGAFHLTKQEEKLLKKIIELRRFFPLAYLRGKQEFYGLDFTVVPGVFIPRPESEQMIDLALQLPQKFNRLFDIGCGSGCLGIAYAKYSPVKTPAVFIDIDSWSLKIARRNARKHSLQEAIFKKGSFIQVLPKYSTSNSLILANLPYLDVSRQADYEAFCPTLKSEPKRALYAQAGGLKYYQSLFSLCSNKTTLLCETLREQQAPLEKLAHQSGFKLHQKQGLISLFVKDC